MKSKVFKIFFYLQHSNFFFTRTKWKCNLILTPCIFLSMIWHIWILVHFAPWPLGEKVWSEKNMFSRHEFIFFVKSILRKISWNQFHEKSGALSKRDLFFSIWFFRQKVNTTAGAFRFDASAAFTMTATTNHVMQWRLSDTIWRVFFHLKRGAIVFQ